MAPEEEIQRAIRAEQILKDELFKEAVREVKEAILNGIEMSAIKDSEMREKLCQQLILLNAVVGRLRTYMETGKLAEETIKQQTIRERIKQAVNW